MRRADYEALLDLTKKCNETTDFSAEVYIEDEDDYEEIETWPGLREVEDGEEHVGFDWSVISTIPGALDALHAALDRDSAVFSDRYQRRAEGGFAQ